MLAAAALAATASIALGTVHPFGDTRADAGAGQDESTPLLQHAAIPAQARAVLIAKCGDCHSYATRWPAYSRLAPGSWLIERDVTEARKHMNLSAWQEMTLDRREMVEAQIARETKAGDMPPLQYRLVHWGARLSAADLQALAALSEQDGASEAGSAGTGDADHGKALFERRCTGCHAIDANREGPHLRGVFGRKAGSIAAFSYSSAIKASGVTWNEEALNRWLTDPDAMMGGNNMDFSVAKAGERADLIAFLKELK
jgi:cytochrome c